MIDALQYIFANLQAAAEAQSAAIRRTEGSPDADTSPSSSSSDVEDHVDAGINEAVDPGVTEATAVAGESSAIATRCEEMVAQIEVQLPAFLERRRAMARAAAGRGARPGFFRGVVGKVKKRFGGWMA